MKFAANLNFLFTEGTPSIAQRLRLARDAGFRAVEIPFPAGEEDAVIKAKQETSIEVALINISLGKDDHRLGCASIPGAEEEFKAHLSQTINFAKAVECKKIHIMAGLIDTTSTLNDSLTAYKENLKYAAHQLEDANIIGLIEPINKYALPSYFMNSYETATSVLQLIKSEHLKLMLDIFHLQHIQGNVSNTLTELKNLIGHIQIAQVPHRHEPDVCGELDFGYVFSAIKAMGYDGWIGCEYKPKTTTTEGLKWLSKYDLKL